MDAAYARAELEYTRARERIDRLKLLKAERKLQKLGDKSDVVTTGDSFEVSDDDNETVDGDAIGADPLA